MVVVCGVWCVACGMLCTVWCGVVDGYLGDTLRGVLRPTSRCIFGRGGGRRRWQPLG